MIYIEEKIPKKLAGTSSLFVSFKYNPDIVAIVKTCWPSNFDKKTNIWEIPATCLAQFVNEVSPIDEIELKLLRTKEEKFVNYELGKYKTKPFSYQEDAIQYGLNKDKWLLLDPPGLGKTLQTLLLAQELKERHNIEHCLVICGVNTLKTNWEKEIAKHTNLSSMILGKRLTRNNKVVFESVAYRLEQLKKPIKEFFVITNVETLRNNDIVKQLNDGKNKFDMVIFDELHTCKNPTSRQGANLLKLKSPKYKIGLTGTLLMNSPLDAYMPLKWIGADNSTYSNFKYQYSVFGGPFNNDVVGYRNLTYLQDQINSVSLRRPKSLLNLPPKTIITEYVDMPDRQCSFYQDVENGVKEAVNKVELKPSMVLSLAMRLRQATACPSILTTDIIPSGKIDRTLDLCDQIISSGSKVVIFSTFKETVYELQKLLAQYNPLIGTGDISDDEISINVDTFQQNSENKVFIGTWQKCGTGFTLTAANYMIFIDTPWTDAAFTQNCDRIYRIGTDTPVTIYNLVAKDTIDERVLEIVEDKSAISNYVLDGEITQKSLASLQKYIEELR